MSSCFLDTSAALDIMRDRSSACAAVEPYSEPLISHVAWGELLAGMHRARNPAAELARPKAFVTSSQVIGADQETAVIYGEMLAELESKGQRIPTNDIWIAATAVQFDLPLLAWAGHFGRLASLRWISY